MRTGLVALGGLRSDRRNALLNTAAACVGAAALVFFLALGLGVSSAARAMFPADARLVEVLPGRVSLGGVLGGGTLDDAAVDAVTRWRFVPAHEGRKAVESWVEVPLKFALRGN